MNFAALGLAPELLRAAKRCGFTQLTPVQEQAIPLARRHRDLLVTAQTGTGKTAAFGFPLLQQLLEQPRARQAGITRALVLAPTRELVEQVADNLQQYAHFTPLKVAAIYGGVKHTSQASKLQAGLDVLVATPGRLLEHVELGNINLQQVEFLVLDEADRMLDMGFVGEISKLLGTMGKKPQILFFSATLTQSVTTLAKEVLVRPQSLAISKRNTVADTVEHLLYPVDQERKYELFMELLRTHNWFQVMVFSSTREEADKLIQALKQDNIEGAVIHSEKTQGSRRRALKEFKEGKLQVLVATEVAARGLDIQGLDYVVNLDLPFFLEDYVHRVGRTGRAGSKGTAISLVSPADEPKIALIEKAIDCKIQRVRHPGYAVTESAASLMRPKSQFAKAVSKQALDKTNAARKPAAAKKAPAAQSANTRSTNSRSTNSRSANNQAPGKQAAGKKSSGTGKPSTKSAAAPGKTAAKTRAKPLASSKPKR